MKGSIQAVSPWTVLVFSASRKLTTGALLAAKGFVAGTPVLYTMFVLFGAPFLSQKLETLALAMAVTVLAVIPGTCLLSGDMASLHRVFFRGEVHSSLVGSTYTSIKRHHKF